MENKEVGELWEEYSGYYRNSKDPYAEDMLNVIRKLVEERKAHYIDNPDFYSRHDGDEIFEIAEDQALRDFGIDPKGEKAWKKT